MGRKRSADEMEVETSRVQQQQFQKRAKQSSPDEDAAMSSATSGSSISETSALQSSPTTSEQTSHSSLSSIIQSSLADGGDDYDNNEDVESESSISTSSSSSSSSDFESDSDTEIITLGGPKKPQISSRHEVAAKAENLQTRLASLLPQIEEANRLLQSKPDDYSMEDVEDGEQHIEMNLGLGVLEQQDEWDDTSTSSASSDDEDEGDEGDTPTRSTASKRPQDGRETDVMGRLMGHEYVRKGVGIQDIE